MDAEMDSEDAPLLMYLPKNQSVLVFITFDFVRQSFEKFLDMNIRSDQI